MTTIFTWLKAISTISCLGKMIAPTIQVRLLFKGGIYCNVIMITVAIIYKPGSFMVQIILFVIYYSIAITGYLHTK